jgi:hypothetical protein
MRQHRSIMWSRLLALGLLLLGSAGCDGASAHLSQPAVLGRAFQTRAVAVCETALKEKKAQGPFPYPDFNPTRPDRSKLPGIARFEARTVMIYKTWLRRMQELGTPSIGQGAWAGVMNALTGHVHFIAEQQAAAARGDTRTFIKDYYEGNKVQDEMVRASSAADVPVCADAAAALPASAGDRWASPRNVDTSP